MSQTSQLAETGPCFQEAVALQAHRADCLVPERQAVTYLLEHRASFIHLPLAAMETRLIEALAHTKSFLLLCREQQRLSRVSKPVLKELLLPAANDNFTYASGTSLQILEFRRASNFLILACKSRCIQPAI